MKLALTLATARRVLAQLRHDPRTIAMLILVPTLLMVLLRFVFNSEAMFARSAPALLGVFPFLIMFLITSVSTLRERTSGTLERLMTLPMGRFDLLLGYALAFGALTIFQVAVVIGVSVAWLGFPVSSLGMVMLIAVLDAVLGMALGLFVSAFAQTEFQAVQFMPLFVLPQVLLCGLFAPRESMTPILNWISDAMPLSYAIEALNRVAQSSTVDAVVQRNLVILAGCTLLALILGATTLRRQTP